MIDTLIFLILIFSLGYGVLIMVLNHLWNKMSNFKPSNGTLGIEEYPKISVVIAARNEAHNIDACLKSILENSFPQSHFEVIVIDDNSVDGTFESVSKLLQPNIKCLKNLNQGKKSAISQGVMTASHEIILCTDADCIVPKNWLLCHSLYYKNNIQKRACIGFVLPHLDGNTLSRFQWLDFAATMVMTLVGHKYFGVYLANGAHMSYKKSTFIEVGGYESDHHMASGDDLFLIKKIAHKFPDSIGFIQNKENIVVTQTEKSWKDLWQQRKRWATKTSQVKDLKVIFFQSWVFGLVFLCFVTLILGIGFFNFKLMAAGVLGLGIKLCIDYFFLKSLSKYFGQSHVLEGFIASSVVYFFHILLSGYFVLRPTKYIWKGRSID